MVVMKDTKVIMDLNDTEVGAGVGVITSETNGAAAPPPGATAEFAAEGGTPIPAVNNNNMKEKSDRPTVTFDPNPTILLTNTDGSPMKVGDLKKGDGSILSKGANSQSGQQQASAGRNPDVPADCYLKELYTQITAVVTSNPDDREAITDDECTDPAAVPVIWVSKWVDYSDKYGLGYQLSDDSIGVLFNDFTKLLLLSDGETIKYIERTSMEHQHHLKNYPPALNKKVTLLRYFRNYMNEHLLKAAASMCKREGDDKFQIPSLRTYFRTRSAIILHLTNGILQINFFEDHTKIILCPIKGAVTYIDEKRNFRTYKMTSLVKNGCRPDLANRLRYARNMIQKLLVTKAFTLRAAQGANTSSSSSTAAAGQQHTTQTATA